MIYKSKALKHLNPKRKEKTMDKQTRDYREIQFKSVSTAHCEFKPKIKIIKPNGETNWLDIEETELEKIKAILLKD